jgi:ABC-type multidrug transport system permease subunit
MDRGGARHPLLELTLVRLREFIREPEALFWAFIFPIILSLALGIAFPGSGTTAVRVGFPPGEAFATQREALATAEGVEVTTVDGDAELRALREGQVHIVVHPGEPPEYRYDASRQESRTARLVVDDVLKRTAGRREPWTALEDPVVIPGSRYVDWLIPGIVGMNIMGNSLWGLGFSIVQMRLRRILKRLVASPMRRWEFLLAQVLARMVFLLPEVAVPIAFGAYAFDMPVLGSVFAIAVVSFIGALGFSGLGLLLASRPKTIEAISGVMNLTMVPMWILSGIFFSAENFPDNLQWFIQALPLTALIDALRAVILEGASLASVAHEVAILAAWGVVPFVIALRVFRWR